MSSPVTSYPPPVTRPDDEVLVRVEGVSKKFCRSLKKSLWYGVCDIAGELLPFGKRQRVAGSELLVASEECRVAEVASSELLVTSENQSAASPTRNSPPVTRHSTEGACHQLLATAPTGASAPVTSYPPLATPAADLNSRDDDLREGEFYAVKNVSFELRRGECLGLIGHNGAGKTTLLKMLNGLIKPDSGSITMRGRVASWSMQKTPQANGAHFRSTLDSGHSTLPIYRHARAELFLRDVRALGVRRCHALDPSFEIVKKPSAQ